MPHIHIELSDEEYAYVKTIAEAEERSIRWLAHRAVRHFFGFQEAFDLVRSRTILGTKLDTPFKNPEPLRAAVAETMAVRPRASESIAPSEESLRRVKHDRQRQVIGAEPLTDEEFTEAEELRERLLAGDRSVGPTELLGFRGLDFRGEPFWSSLED